VFIYCWCRSCRIIHFFRPLTIFLPHLWHAILSPSIWQYLNLEWVRVLCPVVPRSATFDGIRPVRRLCAVLGSRCVRPLSGNRTRRGSILWLTAHLRRRTNHVSLLFKATSRLTSTVCLHFGLTSTPSLIPGRERRVRSDTADLFRISRATWYAGWLQSSQGLCSVELVSSLTATLLLSGFVGNNVCCYDDMNGGLWG
jgi:hypothetical protein